MIERKEGQAVTLEGYGELLTVEQVAGLLGVTEQTVRRMFREGTLPSVKIGRRVYTSRAAMCEHINEAMGACA